MNKKNACVEKKQNTKPRKSLSFIDYWMVPFLDGTCIFESSKIINYYYTSIRITLTSILLILLF